MQYGGYTELSRDDTIELAPTLLKDMIVEICRSNGVISINDLKPGDIFLGFDSTINIIVNSPANYDIVYCNMATGHLGHCRKNNNIRVYPLDCKKLMELYT